MKKTLLLCFIHGFKGGEDTFGSRSEFTEHLAALLSAELPRVNVRTLVYPKFETRGDLHECAARFRDWLQEKVIDLEVAAATPSPTVDPGVRVVLVGHSMGGIVAVETAVALACDKPVLQRQGSDGEDGGDGDGAGGAVNGLMFPYIQGVLAFDTPFLGISPGVVAHGAESHYQAATAALTQLSGLATLWGGGKATESAGNKGIKPAAGVEAPSSSSTTTASDNKKEGDNNSKNAAGSNSGSSWASWGKMAMYAGAAGAIAAGGAAAYLKRDQITEGWSWASSHLEFVGCLAKGEDLKTRIRNMVRIQEELGVGFANLYTRLGKAAKSKQVSMVGTIMGNQRTFCNLPNKMAAGRWIEAVNDKASDEIGAHTAMFEPGDNPGYSKLSDDAKNLIVKWVKNEWYETSTIELE